MVFEQDKLLIGGTTNNIDLYDNKVVINDKTKNNTQMSQNVNLVINKMEILPEENFIMIF